MAKRKTKAEELQEAVAEAVGAGKELHLESVDFSDPNRPKTCLEVDFPILHVNPIVPIQRGDRYPIYKMSKWFARREACVFRSLLIAAATKAPNDLAEAGKAVWDAYYGNHQSNEAFRNLKVADIFMGGGTTIIEGSRLGMEMHGNDLNPVAWLVVNNESAQVDPEAIQELLDQVEADVKPQIMPYFACDCPRGHKGKWTHKPTGEVMCDDFDPLSLSSEQRPEYEYEGPEVIYTFWAKHGPCPATECNHRTPILTKPVIAVKTLTVKAWANRECNSCGERFDIEQKEVRMAPAAIEVVAETESPFATMDSLGRYTCPHCDSVHQDQKAATDGESASLGKAKNKKVPLSLLLHPQWLEGTSGLAPDGSMLGGSVTDSQESNIAWYQERAKTLSLIEIRGTLPESITIADYDKEIFTDERGGTVPRKSVFACQEATCGTESDFLTAINGSGKSAPASPYCIQGYCPECDSAKIPYGGRFFASPSLNSLSETEAIACGNISPELQEFLPIGSVPEGLETSVRTPLHKYKYLEWKHFFNSRQLVIHALLLRAITTSSASLAVKCYSLGTFQQYLRTQNMFCIWNLQGDKLEPFLSKNNFQPPTRPVENAVFSDLGRGNWASCASATVAGAAWSVRPFDTVSVANLRSSFPEIADRIAPAKSYKVPMSDTVSDNVHLSCGTSTDLSQLENATVDLVITDPPFGDIMQYAELSSFFYPWMRAAAARLNLPHFEVKSPSTALEAVANSARHGADTDAFYQKLLTECWREAARILKPAGILAFTFHHDKDDPWIAVLESLFDAGFYLEATFPIRGDETKGEGSTPGTFGAQKVEFDIIHVCRKRLDDTEAISWARLRRQIMRDVRQLQEIIEQHESEGLGEADLQVIRRGKALEYFSRHYGRVYIEKGREDEFTVKDALVGINQLLDDESDTTTEAPPVLAEPYTRQFLRLFADRTSLERDQIQKFLRGTGVSPSEFIDRGWCNETNKIFTVTSPLEWAQGWKGVNRKSMSRDFDQAYFLVGACYDDSGIKVSDTLNSNKFGHHPAIPDLLDWFGKHGSDPDMRSAAKRAKQIYSSWVAKNTDAVDRQQSLFDLGED